MGKQKGKTTINYKGQYLRGFGGREVEWTNIFFWQGGMRGKRVKQLEGKIRRGGKLVFSLPAFGGNLTKEGNRGNKWVGQLVGDLI